MGNDTFIPLLTTTDWNAEWQRLQEAREHSDSSTIWDEKAKTYPVKHGSQQGYVERFLALSQIEPGESVLDMGCGTGALATPLAQEGHRVIACDFSQGMLDVMLDDMRSLGVGGVEVQRMSWSDDWGEYGVDENCVDVAIASRSIATYDLKDALMKLDRVARRRACITLPASLSPKADEELLAAAGFTAGIGRDFLYAFNILSRCGVLPEVAYIPNTRLEVYSSFDEALEQYASIVQGAVRGLASPEQLERIPERLHSWLEGTLVQDERGYHLKTPRNVTWAFIAWTTRNNQA